MIIIKLLAHWLALHYNFLQSLAKCEQEEGGDDDQIVAAISSAVSNIKAQSVNWYTKYRSRWKKCKARMASREKTNTDTRSMRSKPSSHEKIVLAATDTTATTSTTSSSSSATMESIPSLPTDSKLISSVQTDKSSVHTSATGLTRDPEILALLDRYSSELVAMVKQKLQ